MDLNITPPRQRAKSAQQLLLKAAQHPLAPHEVRVAMGELVALVGEWGTALEALQREVNELREQVNGKV